jgi:hypothetical protein
MSSLFPAIPPERRYRHSQPFTPYSIPGGLKYAEWDFERTPQIAPPGSMPPASTGGPALCSTERTTCAT